MFIDTTHANKHELYASAKDPVSKVEGSSSNLISNITKKLNKIAIPAIAVFALSHLSGAEAGPMAYTMCAGLCTGYASPLLMPACILACLPILHAPTP